MDIQSQSLLSRSGVNLDSHFILDACEYDNGRASSSSWSLPNYYHLPDLYRGRTIPSHNVEMPTRSGSRHRHVHPSHNVEMPTRSGSRHRHVHVGPPPSLWLYHQGSSRHQNLQPRGFLQLDDVALVVGDRHSNVGMETEHMSYEELLALGERVGDVSTGLSDETITTQMKIKDYVVPQTSEQQEADCCVICQEEYREQEKIGLLQCGHEFHANCLGSWLLIKNICPLCKSEALTIR